MTTNKQHVIDFLLVSKNSTLEFDPLDNEHLLINTYDDDSVHICSFVSFLDKSFDCRQSAIEFIKEF